MSIPTPRQFSVSLRYTTQGFYKLLYQDLTETQIACLLVSATSAKRSDDMKISARNVLKGKILEVTKGATTSHVKIDIAGAVITSSITNAAVDELKLAAGKEAYAVVKASDVMIGVD
jgi:molybdopterin-binding protein